MREKLADHIGEYVLCKGWIGGWEDIDDCSTRRLYIKQPTIKRANKDLLYEEQETISTEHHLNLFIKYEDLPDYDTTFELNQPILFTGEIEAYTRGNGSNDFGVYATKQSTFSYKLDRLLTSVKETTDACLEDIDLTYLESAAKQLDALSGVLDEIGDRLPTFHKTYEEYRTLVSALRWAVPQTIERTKSVLSSRQYRRRMGARQSAIEEAKKLHPKKKHTKQEKTDLLNAIGKLDKL
jgi:hypothetical protein